MYRNVLIGGLTAAAIVGAGTAALALSGSSSPTPGTPAAHAAAHPGKHADKHPAGQPRQRARRLLRRLVHGEIVTVGPGGFVTHQLIHGSVTDVSAHSISVKAADDTSEAFTITSDTKVRSRAQGKATDTAIGDVHDGDQVVVVGIGTANNATARRVVDLPQ
jgi:preprotein translocase subunit YajC